MNELKKKKAFGKSYKYAHQRNRIDCSLSYVHRRHNPGSLPYNKIWSPFFKKQRSLTRRLQQKIHYRVR